MATFVKVNQFPLDSLKGVHDWSTHALKWFLSNTLPDVTTVQVLTDITQIANGNGYNNTGHAMTVSNVTQTAGVAKAVAADVTITATGSGIPAFRYAVLVNTTPSSPLKPVIGFYDYGASTTLNVGENLLIDADGATGVMQATA